MKVVLLCRVDKGLALVYKMAWHGVLLGEKQLFKPNMARFLCITLNGVTNQAFLLYISLA